MKNLFLAAMAALAFLASCSKQNDEILASTEGAVVHVSFTDDDTADTRAFFGTTAAAETWEKALNSVTMFVFAPDGDLLVKRSFSSSELSSKKATFSLPDVSSGATCEFYAVANLDVASVTSKSALLSLLEAEAASYNGTFAEVTTKAKRTSGFVMSGSASKAVAAVGAVTNVAITLKRTVAKVAVQVAPSSSFGTLYQGAVRVNSITLSRAATRTPVFKNPTLSTGTMNFSATQKSNVVSGKYQNLFYLYENGPLAAGNRVLLTIDATYDMDGDFTTPAGQSSMTYEVELDGTSGGTITRNGYYRVDITINGLSGSDATLAITPAEWETPVTQTIEVGA